MKIMIGKNTPFKVKTNIKTKKADKKDKVKQRVKEYSKGTGYVREEHKFSSEKDDKTFLNIEEKTNLNDCLNYVASQTESHPVESIYSNVKKTSFNHVVNETYEKLISETIQNEEPDKIKKILEYYSQLLNSNNNLLSEKTYLSLVEFFIKNGQLNYASYFLCQVDKLKYNIPRFVLDLFLDSSIAQKIFEKPEEKKRKKRKSF